MNKHPYQDLYDEINKLKESTHTIILSHYYMSPELQVPFSQGGVSDFLGDSLALSVSATRTQADHIILCGVRFMAETAKILNPGKHVYIPDYEAGCSLAESITAEQVKEIKSKYPGAPVIAYINTYAETKAECDIICTSRNALPIAASFQEDTLIFLPDEFMGQNLKKKIEAETGKKLILWNGRCEVHEQFRGAEMKAMQQLHPDAEVLLHWEVPQETVDTALENQKGVLGSTSDIISYVKNSGAQKFILASECDLGAVLKSTYTDREFITPCIKCPHMKKITLENTLELLRRIERGEKVSEEIILDETVMNRARIPLERMMQFA